jgi:hypothetical protein
LYAKNLSASEKAHLVETLWKFLIYTQLAQDIYNSLPVTELTKPQRDLKAFVEGHDFIQHDFSVRLDNVIQRINKEQIKAVTKGGNPKDTFSNVLHTQVISLLRTFIADVLEDTDRVVVLVDNLDKVWNRDEDLVTLSNFLFGLLNIVERISTGFQHGNSKNKELALSLIVFIRSDILAAMRDYAPERDKVRFTVIDWSSDKKLLARVIERRFLSALPDETEPKEVWERFFPRNVRGKPCKDYLVDRVLPRPRDLLYLCIQAWLHAVNYDHTRIEVEDIERAEQDYSRYLYEVLVEESTALVPEIKAFLRKFNKSPEILTFDQIRAFALKADIKQKDVPKAITVLIDNLFLGLETDPDSFEFAYGDRKEDLIEQAERVAEETGQLRYRINPSFFSYFRVQQVV